MSAERCDVSDACVSSWVKEGSWASSFCSRACKVARSSSSSEDAAAAFWTAVSYIFKAHCQCEPTILR